MFRLFRELEIQFIEATRMISFADLKLPVWVVMVWKRTLHNVKYMHVSNPQALCPGTRTLCKPNQATSQWIMTCWHSTYDAIMQRDRGSEGERMKRITTV